jgi:carboxyl-terminal processing protease
MNMPDQTRRSGPDTPIILLGVAMLGCILLAGYLVVADPQFRAVRLLNSAYKIIALAASEAPGADSLALAAADGMIASLDPYSQYLPPDRWEVMREETEGVYCGIGVEMVILDGTVTVVSPIQGSPAHRAGMRAGDRIVSIDGESATDITSMEAAERIRGPQGSTVVLGVERPGVEHLLLIGLQRDEVLVRPVSIAGTTADGIGYVRLTRFSAGAADLLDSILQDFVAAGSTAWILDLRGNPGGLLDEAAAVAGCFLPEGTPVCETRGRRQFSSFTTVSLGRPISTEVPVVALIDEGSASASEIVAAALTDYQRGVIIGRRSFGKGLVQSFFTLGERYALQMTTGRYFTPGGYTFYHSYKNLEDDTSGQQQDHAEDGGLIPHLTVENTGSSIMETELMQNGAFINYLAGHSDLVDQCSFEELWDGFAAEIRQTDLKYQTPLEFAFAQTESTALRSPAAAQWGQVFARLKSPLAAEHDGEYATAETRLKTRLAESILLFGVEPGGQCLSRYLELDPDTKVALEVLRDRGRYDALRNNPIVP